MNFIIDAHLPKQIAALFSLKGDNAIHTSDLPERNRTGDSEIIRISLEEKRIVISKDNDFYYSQILYNKPYKLVLLRTGNLLALETFTLFEKNYTEIISLIQVNFLIELHLDKLFVIK